MWQQVATNKSVGALFPNDADGNAWGDKVIGFPPVLDKQGFKLTDPGRFQNLTDDFSSQISAFRGADAEIVTGVIIPPDFTTFWNQSRQKVSSPSGVGRQGAVVPTSVLALGQERQQHLDRGVVDADPSYKSSLSGVSAAELARGYEQASGKQWTSRSVLFIRCSNSSGSMKRAGDPTDGAALAKAIGATSSTPSSVPSPSAPTRCRRSPPEHRQDAAGRRAVAPERRQIRHGRHRKQAGAADPLGGDMQAAELNRKRFAKLCVVAGLDRRRRLLMARRIIWMTITPGRNDA